MRPTILVVAVSSREEQERHERQRPDAAASVADTADDMVTLSHQGQLCHDDDTTKSCSSLLPKPSERGDFATAIGMRADSLTSMGGSPSGTGRKLDLIPEELLQDQSDKPQGLEGVQDDLPSSLEHSSSSSSSLSPSVSTSPPTGGGDRRTHCSSPTMIQKAPEDPLDTPGTVRLSLFDDEDIEENHHEGKDDDHDARVPDLKCTSTADTSFETETSFDSQSSSCTVDSSERSSSIGRRSVLSKARRSFCRFHKSEYYCSLEVDGEDAASTQDKEKEAAAAAAADKKTKQSRRRMDHSRSRPRERQTAKKRLALVPSLRIRRSLTSSRASSSSAMGPPGSFAHAIGGPTTLTN